MPIKTNTLINRQRKSVGWLGIFRLQFYKQQVVQYWQKFQCGISRFEKDIVALEIGEITSTQCHSEEMKNSVRKTHLSTYK